LREAVRVAERFADGQASKDKLAAAREDVEVVKYLAGPFGDRTPDVLVAIHMAVAATDPRAFSAAVLMTRMWVPLAGRVPSGAAESYLCDLSRCVFGNPFRPVAFDPRWRTADVLGLARGIYEDRAFDRLPLLADALMDAGCADEQVLGHCRSEGPHVRGCWVVDLVLGKE
jgi:hypothetical protein